MPFIGQPTLHEQIRLNEPWDGTHNSQFHDRIIDVYSCPGNKDIKGKANCTYAVIKDNKHCFPEDGKTLGFHSITDGPSNTIAVVEVKKPFCWMDPTADVTLDELKKGINKGRCGSFHPGGCHVGIFDASVQFISDTIDTKILRALATRNGGEISHSH